MLKPSSSLRSYGGSVALAGIWDLLEVREGGPPPRPVQSTPIAFNATAAHHIIKRGITSRAIAPLGDALGLGKGLVADYLDLDRGTANRRAAKDQLLPLHAAEGVLRLMELFELASDTFESEDEASAWLRKPHPMLDGETPLETAKTSYGGERVKDILLALKYGGVV
ncbi:antitoxin Xre/MbcA/ParS toxin-binding domain-containing protein [Roseateles koreensis]|uniref:DUF2384 domain-containing protein n=1 Tax=Roseateles koreensis TaxID=2987526 RepID=A0ABT5KMV7_9BURK|nr:antitoxin Xre/MbcA/ParS toxin-binding domain-containing protein [Roseateles koreensis]MDC8784248.1 DUF2384 domain-containing protein [Roseateles koreensis]